MLLFSYQWLLDVSINGLFKAIQSFLPFQRSVLGNAQRIDTNPNFQL